jgi:serine phosphatase RsbU (regulator of sigma subunit)
MPSLIVRSRQGTCAAVELSRRPITLGRSDTCDVVLRDDGEVSREHAQVWLDEDGRVLVADQGSKNGTRVDGGEPFHDVVQPAARTIHIGEYELEIAGSAPAPRVSAVRFAPDPPTQVSETQVFPSSQGLDLNQQRLGLLMRLTGRIGTAFERKQLLEQALDACCETLGFERGLIALRTPRGDPELPVSRNLQCDEHGAYKVSRTLINRALLHGERAVVNNPATDLAGQLTESLVRFPICSALCVPIMNREEILGVIYGDRVTHASTYTAEDVDFLAAIAQQVGVGLANLRLFQEHLRSQKMLHELDQARMIQRGLLPARPLRRGRVSLAGHNEPSSLVGGDYFDYFELGADRVGLIIADVTGHGLPAALMMANLQAAVRVGLTVDVPLRELALRLNRLVFNNTDSNVFITALLGRVDATTGAVEYVNAGHPPPILLSEQKACPAVGEHSLPFGVDPEEVYDVQRIEPRRDLYGALFYTDGLIDAANPAGELLDLPPVIDALASAPARTAQGVLDQALALVHRHLAGASNTDDLTLLALQFADLTAPVSKR